MTKHKSYKVLTQYLQSARVTHYNTKRKHVGYSDYISHASSETWKSKYISTRFRSTITDQKRRHAFQIGEITNKTYKAILKKYDIMKVNARLKDYRRSGSTKVRNRCIVTSYRTAFKHFGLS